MQDQPRQHEAIPDPVIAEALGMDVEDGQIRARRAGDARVLLDFVAHNVTIDDSGRPIEALRALPGPGLVSCAHFFSIDGLNVLTGTPLEVLPAALSQIEDEGPRMGLTLQEAAAEVTAAHRQTLSSHEKVA